MRALPSLARAVADAGLGRVRASVRLPSVSNEVYRVETDRGPVIVRLATRPRAGVDHAVELDHLRAAAEAGLAPKPLHARPPSGLLVTTFIPSRTATVDEVRSDASLLDAIGRTLRTIHTTLSFTCRFDPIAVLARNVAAVPPSLASAVDLNRHLDALRPVTGLLGRRSVDLAPCHNDPWPGNVLVVDGGVLFVDWEYSGLNDAAWDLADLSVEAALNEDADRRLVRAYTGAGRPRTEGELLARLTMWKPITDVVWSVWSLVELANGNDADDFEAEARRRLTRASASLPAALEAGAR